MPPTFENFFSVLIPPALVWAVFYTASKLLRWEDQRKAMRKFAMVSATFLFGILFILFSVVNLAGFIALLFDAIGVLLILYSFILFTSYDLFFGS